ncbi:hypothetical protein [Halohasta salina]|uniref:hypothetical protein n=1 Tax=Halohasta salina TaxID=2961621 RepID=UPI0020A24E92|nr:hypothetical protein [Halohasta salina]
MDSDGSESTARIEPWPEDVLARLFRSGRYNAVVSWLLVGILCSVIVESVLDVDRLWILFTAATAVIVLLPPVAARDWRMMLPWELLTLALLPILVRTLAGGELGTFGYFLSVAGLALLVTVELHMFTQLTLTHWFAVLLVVLTTMASGAAWAVVRWNLDQQFGTSFLLQSGVTQDMANEALMYEFLWIMLAGLVAGVLFDAYFRGRGRQLRRRLRRVVRR